METRKKQKNKHLTHIVNEKAQAGNIKLQLQEPKNRFQIIKLDEVAPLKKEFGITPDKHEPSSDQLGNLQPQVEVNLSLLLKLYPAKVSYSIEDTAGVLGLSYEFIRESIKKGVIKSQKFGDRPMVNVHELARLLTEGIQ